MSLVENLTVAENIALGAPPQRFGFIDFATMSRRAASILANVGLESISPDTPVSALQLGEQKLVEIARQLAGDCRLLILDEPTDILHAREAKILFEQIERLASRDVAVVFITHRLGEVRDLCQRVSILRDGGLMYSASLADISNEQMIAKMVGRPLNDAVVLPSQARNTLALKVEGLSSKGSVKDVSFCLAKGEILGLSGLMGAGRSELLRLLFGAVRNTTGSISIGDNPEFTRINNPSDAIAQGLALVPKSRKTEGLLLDKSITDNLSLASLNELSKLGWIKRDREQHQSAKLCADLSVSAKSLLQPVTELSGGNQQKVLIGRWLARKDCQILLLDEPTRGVDVGAREGIYQLLNQLCLSGMAVILVSSDLRELMQVCDRIAVMSAGRMVCDFPRNQWSEEKIMTAAFSAYI